MRSFFASIWLCVCLSACSTSAPPSLAPTVASEVRYFSGIECKVGGRFRPVAIPSDFSALPRHFRNRNYFNIKSVPNDRWVGQIAVDERGHVMFFEEVYSLRAFIALMSTYRYRHNFRTLNEIIGYYAPASDCIGSQRNEDGSCVRGANDPNEYARNVARQMGVRADVDLELFSAPRQINGDRIRSLAAAIMAVEIGRECRFSDAFYNEAVALLRYN